MSTWEEFKIYKQQKKSETVMKIEKQYLIEALKNAAGNVSKAAKEIGMQRTNFHTLLKKHNINSRDFNNLSN